MAGTGPAMTTKEGGASSDDSHALYRKPNRTLVGLSRPSTPGGASPKRVDARHKAGHDENATGLNECRLASEPIAES